MQIEKDAVVSIHYTLTDDAGETLDSSAGGDALVYLHGAGNLIPGLEAALVGKAAGDSLTVRLAPADAYGERDEEKIQEVPREMFGEDPVEPGAQYHAAGPDGESLVVTVVEVSAGGVTVDGNHPLAGVPLNFDVQVVEVRAATEDELTHGHVHGPGCSH